MDFRDTSAVLKIVLALAMQPYRRKYTQQPVRVIDHIVFEHHH